MPQRPKPKRLRPGKTHRSAVLADLPAEQRPIAELALQGLQLALEYAPAPPFNAGRPETAPPEVLEWLQRHQSDAQAQIEAQRNEGRKSGRCCGQGCG